MRSKLIPVSLRQPAVKIAMSSLYALLIVSVSGLPEVAAAVSCDTAKYDGFFVGSDNKTTYAVTKDVMTWATASAQAQASGGRLAVITDQFQNDAIVAGVGGMFTTAPYPSSGSKAWIGLSDPTNTAVWCMEGQPCFPVLQRFSWSGGFSGFKNFASGQPDGFCTEAERAIEPDHNCYGEPWVAMDGATGKWSDEGDHGTTPIQLKGIVEWPLQTLDCVKSSTPPEQPVITQLPNTDTGALWCANKDKTSAIECLDTTDGQKLCPLDKVECTIPCADGYSWNSSRLRCEAPVTCVGSGSNFNSSTGLCEKASSMITGYSQPVVSKTEIMKYKARGDVSTGISQFSASPPALDSLSFDFILQNGQVVLKQECAWGGSGNCGNCATPHWDGGCRQGTDITQAYSGNTLTVTATIYDGRSSYDVCDAYDCGGDFMFDNDGVTMCMSAYDGYSYPASCVASHTVDVPGNTTTGAAASADLSEFTQCSVGSTNSSAPSQAQCTTLYSQWGVQIGISDCTLANAYTCSAPVQACEAGFNLIGSVCAQTPSPCLSGGTLDTANGVCFIPSVPVCPTDASLSCKSVQGDPKTYCSPNACQKDTTGMVSSNDTQSGINDKTDDGPKSADGQCLGQLYIFNGKDMRCRKYDRWGMVNSYGKLVAVIALAATGAGSALAAAFVNTGMVGAGIAADVAFAVVEASVSAASNMVIDAATGQFDANSTLTQSGVSILGAGFGSYLSASSSAAASQAAINNSNAMAGFNDLVQQANQGAFTSVQSQVINAVAARGTNPAVQSALNTYSQQIAQIVQDYAPAMQQGLLGNYQETHCCYPDQLSGSCEREEFKEASLAGNGACHIVGTYCASKFLTACMVQKQTSCCFSTLLARIIQEQGRPQLSVFGANGGWGDARGPICRGFTPDEFQSLDFAQIDFTEYEQDITKKMEQVMPALQQHMQDVAGRQAQGLSAQQGGAH